MVSIRSYSYMYNYILRRHVTISNELVSEAAVCKVTSTPSMMGVGLPVVYNFSCTDTCSYWVLYILDSSVPLGGRCSNLPCAVETSSIDNESKVARQSLQLKISGSGMTVATNGSIMAVAQCAYSNQTFTLFRAAVMLRQIKTGAALSPSSSATLDLFPPKKVDEPTMSPTTTAPTPEDSIIIYGRLKRRHVPFKY